MREHKLATAHFDVTELEADYRFFKKHHFEMVDIEVMKLLKFYCNNNKDDKGEPDTILEFFFTSPTEEDEEAIKYRTFIHTFEFYGLAE